MSAFVGSYKGTLDAKNRVHIPSKLRQSSDVSLEVSFLTLGLDGCLFLFPRSEWGQILEKFNHYSFAHGEANFFLRTLMSNAGEVNPDGQHRILIPPDLAAKVGITREVRIVGMVKRIEIWSVEKFDQYIAGYGKSYEEVAGQLLL
jgi:MraZ protein